MLFFPFISFLFFSFLSWHHLILSLLDSLVPVSRWVTWLTWLLMAIFAAMKGGIAIRHVT